VCKEKKLKLNAPNKRLIATATTFYCFVSKIMILLRKKIMILFVLFYVHTSSTALAI
jgi:hypothetical protein